MSLIALFAAGVAVPAFMPSWRALGLCALCGAGLLVVVGLQRSAAGETAPWFGLLMAGFALGLGLRTVTFFYDSAAEDAAIRRSLPRELPPRWRDY
jgi:hypothetical protein